MSDCQSAILAANLMAEPHHKDRLPFYCSTQVHGHHCWIKIPDSIQKKNVSEITHNLLSLDTLPS